VRFVPRYFRVILTSMLGRYKVSREVLAYVARAFFTLQASCRVNIYNNANTLKKVIFKVTQYTMVNLNAYFISLYLFRCVYIRVVTKHLFRSKDY
jgi:hypothetical protein